MGVSGNNNGGNVVLDAQTGVNTNERTGLTSDLGANAAVSSGPSLWARTRQGAKKAWGYTAQSSVKAYAYAKENPKRALAIGVSALAVTALAIYVAKNLITATLALLTLAVAAYALRVLYNKVVGNGSVKGANDVSVQPAAFQPRSDTYAQSAYGEGNMPANDGGETDPTFVAKSGR